MTPVDDLSDRYVDAYAALDPCTASRLGISGHDDRLTDYSPDGHAARDELNRGTLRELDGISVQTPEEGLAGRVLREHLQREIEVYAAGVATATISGYGGPISSLRYAIELLDQGEATPWPAVLNRMKALPAAIDGLRATAVEVRGEGRLTARRQIRNAASDCDRLATYLPGLVARRDGAAPGTELAAAAAEGAAGFTALAAFLREDLLPHAPERDAVGRDEYDLGARYSTGTRLDLLETYAWGWEELARLDAEMSAAAEAIRPGAGVAAVIAALDTDPAYVITGRDNFRAYLQDLADRAIADLHGVHFDIPEPLWTVECRLTPTDTGGVYYLPPADDLSRPGQVWWTMEEDATPAWTVPATMYHEGAPGHHLQLGMTVLNAARLNKFRRVAAEWNHSGHAEGWGLYAERLMHELGYYADPAHHLGMLAGGQQLRASRIVLDIGMHLELEIPRGTGFHEGERWNRELGLEFMRRRVAGDDSWLRYEIDRYLGNPGQAISYKVGEKLWWEIRGEAEQRLGDAFDAKVFHARALDLGSMGLDAFRDAMADPALT